MASLAWMFEEDDQLRAAVASGESIAAISRRLCRSERAIDGRARKLGIALGRHESLGVRRLVELGPESEDEMRAAELQELEEMGGKLLEATRKLPPGPDRHNLLREVGRFRAHIAALQSADLRPVRRGRKAKK